MQKRLSISHCTAAIVSVVLVGFALADAPTSQPDLSSPRAAAKSLRSAVRRGDADAVRQIMVAIPDDPQQQLIGCYADLIVAAKRMADAAQNKFPGSTTPFAQALVSPDDSAAIDRAQLDEQEDSATLTPQTDAGRSGPTAFRKIDGQWRVIVPSGPADRAASDGSARADQIALLRAMRDVMNQTADEIDAGKFSSVQEAETAARERLGSVIAKSLQGDIPTTRPTTLPEKSATTTAQSPPN